jgi:S1-C subfamily serine protease
MRENESDSGDNWPGPYDYISPWAAREKEAADQTSADGDHQDTGAFGGQADGLDQGSYVERGNLDQWYGSDREESHYGRYAGPGSRGGDGPADGDGSAGGWGSAAGDGSAGGWASAGGDGSTAGWGSAGESGSAGGGYGSGSVGWDPGPPRRRPRHLLIYLTVAALAAGVGAALTVAFDGQGASPSAGVSTATSIPSPRDNAAGGSALNAVAVERKVKPGLVDITSTLKYASETAEGTGMILSPSGLVLTNNHVIDGATEITVTLADNRLQTYPAQVVGYDSTDDVAVLQLTRASGLATVSFGDSSQVRVGTPVLALGDAEGRGSVTPAPGNISGLDRSIQASDEGSGTTEDLNHMLETNAGIQQGDSGGALANSAGQVIGMVTAANTGSDGQPGGTMGFAIPIDTALIVARQIADHQASSTVYIGLPGFLGVEVAQSDSPNPRRQAADEAQSGDNQGGSGRGRLACVAGGQEPGVPGRIAPVSSGALILGILCGTAAQSRGLAPGDVIISVNGQAVTTPDSLTAITAMYHPGNVVSVGWEDIHGSRHTARFVLGYGPPR